MTEDKVLVTGASRGLGMSTTRALLEAGYCVIAMNRSAPPELTALQDQYPGLLDIVKIDLEQVDTVNATVCKMLSSNECKLVGFVNNAAYAYDDLVTNLQAEPLDKMYRINVFSPMLITRAVIRNFILHRTAGSIVHISSISAHTGYKGLAMYASTKGALEAFSKNAAREWGERGIRVNCIVCGFMETKMSDDLDESQKARIYRRTSLKRPTDPLSVAAMIRYLISDDSNSVTGQNLHVDSGTI